jgi:tellurite resistance protein TerB
MGFFDQLKTKSAEMSAQLKTKAHTFKNDAFADGAMAMCALIAAADGSIDASERQKTASFIVNNDILSVFPQDQLRTTFDKFCGKLENDYDFGKIEVLAAIGKLKKKPDQARAVIQIGIIIGGADGNFDADEKKAVKDACFACGIPPTEFDL